MCCVSPDTHVRTSVTSVKMAAGEVQRTIKWRVENENVH